MYCSAILTVLVALSAVRTIRHFAFSVKCISLQRCPPLHRRKGKREKFRSIKRVQKILLNKEKNQWVKIC